MGLTSQSTGSASLRQMQDVRLDFADNVIVALAGNPNTGKSTVFNSLTGLNQHTGNWTGKTVATARGNYKYNSRSFILVDLPGTYSLLSNSAEEEAARNFICFGNPHVTVVVADATCLERNLNLVLQILEMTDKVVVCVNLMDEARRKSIRIDLKRLSQLLGVPVIGTNARKGTGLDELKDAINKVSLNEIPVNPLKIPYDQDIEETIRAIEEKIKPLVSPRLDSRWVSLKLLDKDKTILDSINNYLGTVLDFPSRDKFRDRIVSCIVRLANDIYRQVVHMENKKYNETNRRIDDILTSNKFGIPIMILLLALILWITLQGANIPSAIIMSFLFGIQDKLTIFFIAHNLPDWLHGVLILGIYRTLAWVVSVMLPPMAIFFPLFTFLEDLGYLPRVAFNLDNFFKKACAHGKQALTMCMGFGCNAAGVIGCRIIDSPRERLIAIITNSFVPCNGRFPTLITITGILIAGVGVGAGNMSGLSAETAAAANGIVQGLIGTLAITCIVVLGVFMTLFISKLLSKTILKGLPSSFALELPPFRRPQIGRILVRSLLDRTVFVLGRAVAVAAPAGLVVWLMANIDVHGISLLDYGANYLQPLADLLGLDGYILMAFILGFPANEIVIPILLMSYTANGSIFEINNLAALRDILVDNGWTWLTAVNMMLISLMHFPCATTVLTIRKETGSVKWTLASFLIPTLTGVVITFAITQIARLLGLA
jgi:ferrous iron transport protein B